MESQNESNNKGKNTFDKGNTTNIPTFAAIKHQIHKYVFYMRLNNIKKAFLVSAALLSTMSMSAAERFVSFKQDEQLPNQPSSSRRS